MVKKREIFYIFKILYSLFNHIENKKPMKPIFRKATEKDYPDIISFHKSEKWGLDTQSALKNFQNNGNLIIVCEKDGEIGDEWIGRKIVGKMDLMQKRRADREFLYIERVYISPEYRRQGIAKQFLEYAEQECRKRGLHFIELSLREENIPAKMLYLKHGFQEIGKKIYMQKKIV